MWLRPGGIFAGLDRLAQSHSMGEVATDANAGARGAEPIGQVCWLALGHQLGGVCGERVRGGAVEGPGMATHDERLLPCRRVAKQEMACE
jgi:hypothetical protein